MKAQLLTVSAAWRTAAEAGANQAEIFLSHFQKYFMMPGVLRMDALILHSAVQNVPNFSSPVTEEACQNLCSCTLRSPLETTVERQRSMQTLGTGHRMS